jgi:hypothetical protein
MSRLERTVGPIGAVLGGIVIVGAAFAAATAATAVVFARRVVTPELGREDDIRIDRVDLAAGEVVLSGSEDARLRGRYGLWFEHDSGYARIGDVLHDDGHRVRRVVESVEFGRLDRAARGRISGWMHLGPWEVAEQYENVVVALPAKPSSCRQSPQLLRTSMRSGLPRLVRYRRWRPSQPTRRSPRRQRPRFQRRSLRSSREP